MTGPADGTTSLAIVEGIATLTIENEARRNALSMGVRLAMRDHLRAAMGDPAVRVIIITGAGAQFCAGGDLSTMGALSPWAFRKRLDIVHDIIKLMVTGPRPVIAAVEGHAAGGGLSLAVAADLIVAADNATFTSSFVRVGLAPDMGLAHLLPRRVGLGPARRLMLTADPMKAPAALGIGLVDQMVAPGQALAEARALALRMATLAPTALATTKRLLARAPADLDGAMELEAQAQALLFSTDDFREGTAAFLEKRPTVFQDR